VANGPKVSKTIIKAVRVAVARRVTISPWPTAQEVSQTKIEWPMARRVSKIKSKQSSGRGPKSHYLSMANGPGGRTKLKHTAAIGPDNNQKLLPFLGNN